LAKYICCGLPYADSKTLTDHMRADHSVKEFSLVVSCCGVNFKDGAEMSRHMKAQHKIDLSAEI